MIVDKLARVSIVIPVYNEAGHIGACLEAIAAQTAAPYEVIVVDNNSTDDTVAIAERYPFVKVLREPRQGVVYARDRGFDAVTGDIIGRLDADSIIAPDWVATLRQLFTEDDDLAAVTGKVRYYGLALSSWLDAFDLRIRRRMARLLGREIAMQGANLALRRSAWQQVKRHLCRVGGMHEDYDLAIHLAARHYKITFDERMEAMIDSRRLRSSWRDFRAYAWLSPQTYAQHHLKSRRHMYPVVALVIICYLPLKLLHRGFNAETKRFSWYQLLTSTASVRVNPATFVD
ncbi:MAG: glycosyltransferase family 2 protein [Candidatus Saccharimonadales bacterium]